MPVPPVVTTTSAPSATAARTASPTGSPSGTTTGSGASKPRPRNQSTITGPLRSG
jgi:hypothetical protein